MSTVTIQIPDSLRRSIQALADQDGYSLEQFVASAAAEKLAAMRTLAYLQAQATQGRREDFHRYLAAVPDNEPSETDRVSE
ncbi:MAG TPA: hypothetical protein VGI40_13710 [Pirellulaceae bacterium]|jgi:regulator of sirC expression with transglutaminase-like and TPR domain